jgi:hypothetical protein
MAIRFPLFLLFTFLHCKYAAVKVACYKQNNCPIRYYDNAKWGHVIYMDVHDDEDNMH